MTMLNNPNGARLINLNTGDLYFIDEVLIPETVGTNWVATDLNQLERHWMTEIETAVKTELMPTPVNGLDIFTMEVVMVEKIFNIFFIMVDLPFSPRNRKRLVAIRIETKD